MSETNGHAEGVEAVVAVRAMEVATATIRLLRGQVGTLEAENTRLMAELRLSRTVIAELEGQLEAEA
jgi:hypothetical protein